MNQLLNYAEAKFEAGRIFLDKDFYTEAIKDELKERGQDFIITAPRYMDAFGDLITGTEFREDSWNSQPYEIGLWTGDDADHYLFVNPSEKRLKRSETGLEDAKNGRHTTPILTLRQLMVVARRWQPTTDSGRVLKPRIGC